MHDEVIFEGSVFASPTASREAVMNAMRQSSSICDRLEFTHQTQSTDRTCFEWKGTALGSPVWPMTAIALEEDGQVRRVVLSHLPLDLVLKFSAALTHRLEPH